jgi:biopolymer transport protein ExbB/TolQ
MAFQTGSGPLDFVERACGRAAADEHIRLRRGLGSLATIAAISPLFGFFGTIIGIVNAFLQSGNGDKSTIMAGLTWLLSESLMPTAISLLVAIPASAFYKSFTNRLVIIDIEMKAASLNLANALARLPYHS